MIYWKFVVNIYIYIYLSEYFLYVLHHTIFTFRKKYLQYNYSLNSFHLYSDKLRVNEFVKICWINIFRLHQTHIKFFPAKLSPQLLWRVGFLHASANNYNDDTARQKEICFRLRVALFRLIEELDDLVDYLRNIYNTSLKCADNRASMSSLQVNCIYMERYSERRTYKSCHIIEIQWEI